MEQAIVHVLAMNVGSSSIKFATYDIAGEQARRLHGKLDRVESPGTTLTFVDSVRQQRASRDVGELDHQAAMTLLIEWLALQVGFASLLAVGHRVVSYGDPRLVTDALLEELRRITPYATEHLPSEIGLIERIRARAHAASSGVFRQRFSPGHAACRENPARSSAPYTSMGLTPAAGVPMSTRSGDLDRGLVGFLARTKQMTAAQFHRMVNHESGLLGVSETSADIRDLLDREAHDVRAAEAAALFCYQIKKWIGAYAAALGGLDTLVFAGGIGENAPVIRVRICEGLSFLEIDVDPARNERDEPLISAASGRVAVRIIRTDEEITIAKSVVLLLGAKT
ncbi:acetate/propionate family kinase [Gemmatimonas sp.]|uniref:acetate/propionate family kinase n=1 Tax=Gemmatimonas sp. TaxID=1962908 RepID=UPI003983CB98